MKVLMRKIVATFLLVFACDCFLFSQPSRFDGVAEGKKMYALLTASSQDAVVSSLRELFHRCGANYDSTLLLKYLPYSIPISFYDPNCNRVNLTEFPPAGRAEDFWVQWDLLLQGGKWKIVNEFRNKKEMQMIANFALMGVAAHELGHHMDFRFPSERFSRAEQEFRANHFTVAVMNYYSAYPPMKALRDKYFSILENLLRNIDPLYSPVVPADRNLEKMVVDYKINFNPVTHSETLTYAAMNFSMQKALSEISNPLAIPVAVHDLILTPWILRNEKMADFSPTVRVTTSRWLNHAGSLGKPNVGCHTQPVKFCLATDASFLSVEMIEPEDGKKWRLVTEAQLANGETLLDTVELPFLFWKEDQSIFDFTAVAYNDYYLVIGSQESDFPIKFSLAHIVTGEGKPVVNVTDVGMLFTSKNFYEDGPWRFIVNPKGELNMIGVAWDSLRDEIQLSKGNFTWGAQIPVAMGGAGKVPGWFHGKIGPMTWDANGNIVFYDQVSHGIYISTRGRILRFAGGLRGASDGNGPGKASFSEVTGLSLLRDGTFGVTEIIHVAGEAGTYTDKYRFRIISF